MSVRFIPMEVELIIHGDVLQRYGGRAGIRDAGLLAPALAQPAMIVGGKFVHPALFDKAAAYGFHVCQNHPFIDGNKRVAFVLMDIFLQKNKWELTASDEEAYSMMIELASGKLSKSQLAVWLKNHSSAYRHR